MVPAKGKNGRQVLRCPKCGYEEEVDAKAKSSYVQTKEIGEDKHRKIAVVEEEKDNLSEEEKEMIEDYQKQLLENLYEDERGGESED
ncbi:DNA-directed RNA polymerase [Thermocladium modestius]|uniref:DNA-directed RNA polymerase n=2 Tax=Thermocladium modestius TaxID=62609 RepID=A0A830GV54_9CREN|nr:DNA-directed RNA polymerase [Thermocladium modestius]